MQYVGLESVIKTLCKGKRIHICVHGVSDIMQNELLVLGHENKVHAAAFCDAAKATDKGYALCMRCKTVANRKAVRKQSPFAGYCPYGLFEIVRPVSVDGSVVCILYLGNMVLDRAETARRLEKAANETGADTARLFEQLSLVEEIKSVKEYEEIALILESYIRLLIQSGLPKGGQESQQSKMQWKIGEIRKYIEQNYNKNISVGQLAGLYFTNEKYLGRMFLKETGVTVRQYLLNYRLAKAEKELCETEKSILEISLDCGFQNVSYFNRSFLKRNQITPGAYRSLHRQKK